LWSEYWFRW